MGGSFEGFLTRRPLQLVEGTPGSVPRSGPQPEEAWTDGLQRTARQPGRCQIASGQAWSTHRSEIGLAVRRALPHV